MIGKNDPIMRMPSRPVVAVIGKGRDCPDEIAELAADAGRAVAQLGAVLVTGGLGGAMRAAAQAALEIHDSLIVGLVPAGRETDAYHSPGVITLNTGLPEVYRNALTASVADAAIVVPGSHGTVQEGMVLAERGVPLIGYGDHVGWRSLILQRDWVKCTTGPLTLLAALCGPARDRAPDPGLVYPDGEPGA